jgi:4-hydroxyphenylpyruvate dioxygenase
MTTLTHHEQQTTQDVLQLNGTDYIEFYVGNARQAAYFYRLAMGFSLVAYAGPETGRRDRASYVLQQGKICFVLTTPLRPDNEVAEHIHLHGDGVRDVALWVDDARLAWKEATRRGARSVQEPFETADEYGRAKMAAIAIYGDAIHTFVERKNYRGPFLPGYQARTEDPLARPTGLTHVDHVVGNVGWSEMDRWVDFYAEVMGFSLHQHFNEKDIPTEYSAWMSKVMANGDGRIKVKFPLNEPAEGRSKSQIEEYLEFHHGPGVQHIALATDDILHTVGRLREQGVEFLSLPQSYYSSLQARTGWIDEPVEELEKLGIMVDRDDEGYMLRIFTRPVEDRPTLFFEIIQRKGSRSFGNFRALFEAIEREQGEL